MLASAALLVASFALLAAPARAADAGAEIVVIRGSEVSVARPLEAQRAVDGRARVEFVRVEPAPRPSAARAPREPEPEIVFVAVPVPAPVAAVGIPLGWGPGPGWGWRRLHHHGTGPLVPGFHPLWIQPGSGRKNLHGR